MIIAVDFDGTIVKHNHHETNPDKLEPVPGAVDALKALKRAGHTLILWSTRANRALRDDPELDPLVRAGVRKVDRAHWEKHKHKHEKRYEAMVKWVRLNLPGVFTAIDDGRQGKPDVDLFIDDKGVSPMEARGGWSAVAQRYG